MSWCFALRSILVALSLCCLSACTSTALQSSTVAVGGTVGTIIEQQALQNLARFIDDPYAIPSHLIIGNGLVEVVNTVVPAIKETTAHAASNTVTREMNIPLTMTWKESWTTVPVVSHADLKDLQAHYKSAVTNSRPSDRGACADASSTAWLCVDPEKSPGKLVYKGRHSGHAIWVHPEGFSAFVFDVPEKAKEATTKSNRMMQLQLMQ